MASPKLRELDRRIRAQASPRFAERGFAGGSGRHFRRLVEHEGTTSAQVLQFQVGIKSLAGFFTVNLGVFNPELGPKSAVADLETAEIVDCGLDLQQRLGYLRRSRLARLRGLFATAGWTASDHWWRQSASPRKMTATLDEVLNLVEERGLPWLDRFTSRAAFAWVGEELARRRAWREAGGKGYLEPTPFEPPA